MKIRGRRCCKPGTKPGTNRGQTGDRRKVFQFIHDNQKTFRLSLVSELLSRIERDPKLLRLPLIRGGKRLSVGHDEDAWKAMLNRGSDGTFSNSFRKTRKRSVCPRFRLDSCRTGRAVCGRAVGWLRRC